MKVYLKLRGKYIGVDPHFPTVVYADRTSANGWESVELSKLGNNFFSAKFHDANVVLSIQADGTMGTRPVDQVNDWEQFVCVSMPSEYHGQPDQLFHPIHGTILEIEAQS